jgi:hypothetical protein
MCEEIILSKYPGSSMNNEYTTITTGMSLFIMFFLTTTMPDVMRVAFDHYIISRKL